MVRFNLGQSCLFVCFSISGASLTNRFFFQDHYSCHRPPESSRCFLYKLEQDPAKGVKMVALRDIKPLEVILEEYPVAVGPYPKTVPQCLECFKPCSPGAVFKTLKKSTCATVLSKRHLPSVPADDLYRCSGCNFPLCGPECEAGPLHSKQECPVFQRAGFRAKIPNLDRVNTTEYASINTLRTLLQKGQLAAEMSVAYIS